MPDNISGIFEQRYALLNDAQKRAVDIIDGPVMVIAGPGTGKTEVLGMRIANLLRSDAQVAPHEVLCLTYTEEAAFNMRKRLIDIVGLPAQKVAIFTFHGFCNQIIQNHSEFFGKKQMDLVSDLERIDIMRAILAGLSSDHPMYRTGSSTFFDLVPLLQFFAEMKKENWTTEDVCQAIDAYIADLPDREEFRYKRKYKEFKAGDLNEAKVAAAVEKMNRSREAALLFDQYRQRMENLGRYDYADMILWVIDAFKKHPYLLQQYQERFQYILVDEFQDTNGAQNEILQLLSSFWEDNPNLFVVGDDDQSIYEFQGARLQNVADFYHKYKEHVQVVVLDRNYRSSQPILDLAMRSIAFNRQRLVNELSSIGLHKDIRAALPRFAEEDSPAPEICVYPNARIEAFEIVRRIEALAASGVSLDQVAILYAQHKQAEDMISLFEQKQIPFTVKKSVNVLDEPLITQILLIFEYIKQEKKKVFSGEHILFELMHAPYFGISPLDIAKLAWYMSGKEAKDRKIRYWRQLLEQEMLLSTLELSALRPVIELARLLDSWIQHSAILRVPMLLEKIVYDGAVARWALGSDEPLWQMEVLQSFFDFVKANCTVRTTIGDFLEMIEKMQSEGIGLPIQKIFRQEKGVQLYTTHSAKGLEFEYVYLIGVNSEFWEKKPARAGFAFPDTLTRTVDDQDKAYKTEVSRRLFFVALTRAKKHLYVSYNQTRPEGNTLLHPSAFVYEAFGEEHLLSSDIEQQDYLDDVEKWMRPRPEAIIRLLDRQLLAERLADYALSVSALNKYLRCPIAFYYEEVIKIPTAENDNMAFGTAIHYALERAFIDMLRAPDKAFPPVEVVLGYFRYKMQDKEIAFTDLQFERRIEKGQTILSDYYLHHLAVWNKDVQLEKWFNSLVGEVPIKGKIDKIEMLGNQHCRVIDYKTGKPDTQYARENLAPPNDKNEGKGGDYWRQMLFYKLLIENQPQNILQVSEGHFDYIEKSEKSPEYSHKIIFIPSEEAVVKEQIREVYRKIKNQEFDRGCNKEDCVWCSFVRQNRIAVQQYKTQQEADI